MLRLFLISILFPFTIAAIIACAAPSKADPPKKNLATDFAAMIPSQLTGKCAVWTEDSVLCKVSETALLWCTAPKEGRPHCEVAADWSPPKPEQPKPPESPPAKPKK